MLSEPNARILLDLRNRGGIIFSDERSAGFTNLRLDDLVAQGYIHRTGNPSGIEAYQILPAGADALSAFLEERKQRAADKANQELQKQLEDKRWRKDARRSWVQFAITTILTLASFFAGAMVEKFTGLIEWISSLFH